MSDQPLSLELYGRPGCHLCDDLRELCEHLRGEFCFQFAEVNIELDPVLLARYDREVPVLFVDGRKAVKYRTTEIVLRRLLQRHLFVKRFFGS